MTAEAGQAHTDTPRLLTTSSLPTGGRTLYLLIPGLGGNQRQWQQVEEELVRAGQVVAHLPPVLAHPALAAHRPLIGDMAAAAERELREAGVGRVVVLTHSVGTFVGVDLAARLPGTVAGVVAVNGGLYGVGRFLHDPVREILSRPGYALAALRMFALAAVPAPPAVRELVLRRAWLFRLLAGRLVPAEVARSESARRTLAQRSSPPGVVGGLWANRHHWPAFLATAPRVCCPVVIVTGLLDPLSGADDSVHMAALFPDARAVLLAGVGHAATVEAPTVVVDLALALARRTTDSDSS